MHTEYYDVNKEQSQSRDARRPFSPCVGDYPNELAEIIERISFPIGVIRDRTLHRISSSFALHNKARCDWTGCSFSTQIASTKTSTEYQVIGCHVPRLIKRTIDHKSRGMSVIIAFQESLRRTPGFGEFSLAQFPRGSI